MMMIMMYRYAAIKFSFSLLQGFRVDQDTDYSSKEDATARTDKNGYSQSLCPRL